MSSLTVTRPTGGGFSSHPSLSSSPSPSSASSPYGSMPSPHGLVHTISSPIVPSYRSTVATPSTPSYATSAVSMPGTLSRPSIANTYAPTPITAVSTNTTAEVCAPQLRRDAVAMHMGDMEDLVKYKLRLQSGTTEKRKTARGPRSIVAPSDVVQGTGDHGIDITRPREQNVVISLYVEDTMPREQPDWVTYARDKDGNYERTPDGEHYIVPLNGTFAHPMDPSIGMRAHWKYTLDRGHHWKSAFPGNVRCPIKIKSLDLPFAFATEMVSGKDFVAQLKKDRGVIKLSISAEALQFSLCGTSNVPVSRILVDAIEISDCQFNVPLSLNLQLYSCALDGIAYTQTPLLGEHSTASSALKTPSVFSNTYQTVDEMLIPLSKMPDNPWIPATTPNIHLDTRPSTGSGRTGEHLSRTAEVVEAYAYLATPHTTKSQRDLLYGIPTFSAHPMFQRWINVSLITVYNELNSYNYDQRGPYYQVPAPNNNPEAAVRDVPMGKFVQFICLDEWKSMQDYAAFMKCEHPLRIESERTFQSQQFDTYDTEKDTPEENKGGVNDALFFYVPKDVLLHFVNQKFTDDPVEEGQQWLLNKDRYFMRVDQPVYLRLTIPHTNHGAVIEACEKYVMANPSTFFSLHCKLTVLYEDAVHQ